MTVETIVDAVESSNIIYAMEVMDDERMREVECPVCGLTRGSIEQDATFIYDCEECGIKVRVTEFENNFL